MAKILFTNKFHGTSGRFSIKEEFLTDIFEHVSSALDYAVFTHGDLAPYARKKIAEIKKALCGASDCQCTFMSEE